MTQPVEREARHLLPGDHIRHDGQVCRVTRVAVSPDAVEIAADIIVAGAPRGATTLHRGPTDPMRVVAAPAATTPTTPAPARQPELVTF